MVGAESDIRQKFLDSLMDLVDDGIEALGEEAVAGLLWDSLVELDPSTYRHECRFSTDQQGPRVTIQYRTPLALRRDIEKFVEVCGLMIEVDPAPPLMETLEIVVTAAGVDDEVQLSGRAVHQADREVALELTPEGDSTAGELESLAEAMRQSRDEGEKFGGLAASLTDETATVVDEPDGDETTELDESDGGRPAVDQLVDCPDEVANQWRLEETDVEEMILELTDLEGYGFIEISDGDETIQYVLHYGKLIDVRRTPPVDSEQRLVDELVSAGYVDDGEVERAEVLASIHEIPVQDALVDMGCMTLEQMLEGIRGRLVEQLDELWSRDRGEVRLYRLEHRPPLRLRRSSIDLVEQLVERIERRLADWSDEQFESFRRDIEGSRVVCKTPTVVDLERTGWGEDRRRFVEVVLDEPHSMFELDRMSNLSERATLKMLAILEQLEMLERRDRSRRRPEHDKIEGLYAGLARSNHFEVLGVHWSAHGDEIEEAYRQLRDLLDVPDQIRRQLSDEIDEVSQAVQRAYSVLSDPESRREYRNSQVDRSARQSALKVYKDKVETLEMREDKSDLMEALRRVLELEPNNDEARRKLEALHHARQHDDGDD